MADKKKWNVYYRYIMSGHVMVEADSAEEAKEDFQSAEDFGDEEKLVKFYTPTVRVHKTNL